jgi:uncharacterized protein (DUF488 family)
MMIEKKGSMRSEEAGPVVIFSIGHSNQTIEAFISLLQQHNIHLLVDVRSSPYSKYAPQFNSTALIDALQSSAINYLHMGEALGGRPQKAEFYDHTGHVLYKRVAQSDVFLKGIQRLIVEGRQCMLAMMCSEEDPAHCHRHLLIGHVLTLQGVSLLHIRGDGSIQTEEELVALREKPAYEQPLWGEEVIDQEETSWRSIRPVLRRNLPASSSDH